MSGIDEASEAAQQAGKAYLHQTQQQHATCSSTCPCVHFASGLLQAVQDSLQSLDLTQGAKAAAEQAALAQLVPQLVVQLLVNHPRKTKALHNAAMMRLFHE